MLVALLIILFGIAPSLNARSTLSLHTVEQSADFELGAEALPLAIKSLLRGDGSHDVRIALATNQTGLDQKGNRIVDQLLRKGYHVSLLISPEHGIRGNTRSGVASYDGLDPSTGLETLPLFDPSNPKVRQNIEKKINAAIDVIIYDTQDAGMAHYTRPGDVTILIDIAARYNKQIIIFDRPNPLGAPMEGPLSINECMRASLMPQIPLRHGMTIGELALYYNQFIAPKSADLKIVKMVQYQRNQSFAMTAPLSPNLKTLDSVYGYCFLGLMSEVRPFFVGHQSPHVYRVLMLPRKKSPSKDAWEVLAKAFASLGIEATYGEYAHKNGDHFTGLFLSIATINQCSTIKALTAIGDFIHTNKIKVHFSTTKWQAAFPHRLDRAFGNAALRNYFLGEISKNEFLATVNRGMLTFYQRAKSCFLYAPYPSLNLASPE